MARSNIVTELQISNDAQHTQTPNSTHICIIRECFQTLALLVTENEEADENTKNKHVLTPLTLTQQIIN